MAGFGRKANPQVRAGFPAKVCEFPRAYHRVSPRPPWWPRNRRLFYRMIPVVLDWSQFFPEDAYYKFANYFDGKERSGPVVGVG